MSDVLVDQVKGELNDNKLRPKCPTCGSRALYGVFTNIYLIDLVSETSSIVSGNGTLLDVYCDCGWSLGNHEWKSNEEG